MLAGLGPPAPARHVAPRHARHLETRRARHAHHVDVLLPLGGALQLEQRDVVDKRGVVKIWMNSDI